jgi:hypothetical protein
MARGCRREIKALTQRLLQEDDLDDLATMQEVDWDLEGLDAND